MATTNPFSTPGNERSFSAIVDEIITTTGRSGNLIEIVSYVNETIRECQGLGLFARDLVEDTLDVDVAPFSWTRPAYFRKLRTAKYRNADYFPKFILPGKKMKDEFWYFYSANNYFIFAGADIGEYIDTAVYYWAKPLVYYSRLGVSSTNFPGGPYAIRPAYFDTILDKWQYLNADSSAYVDTTGSDDGDVAAQANVSNWLTDEWKELITRGARAKVFSQFGDQRLTPEYAAYKANQALLRNTSGYEAEGF